MKFNDLKENKELISTALLAVSALSVVMILFKVTGFFAASAKAESAIKSAIRHSEPDSKNVAAQLDKSRKVADALKKSNLFAPPAAKQNPIKAVAGIFGSEALINGRWYKAGDRVADAMILAVNPTSVETEWDGKKKTFSPIDSSDSGSGGSSRPSRSMVSTRSSSSSSSGRPQMIVTKSSSVKMPSKSEIKQKNTDEKKRISQMYKNFSDGQRDMFKRVMKERSEQFKRMDDKEKAHFKTRVIERISHSGKR